MAEINLVTGYRGEIHVSAVDHRNLNAACFGSDEFVTENNAQFSISVRSNNEVRINSGDGIMQGAQFRINEGEYVDLNIENGIAGYKRNDLVVARYTKDSLTGVEKVELAVKKGTATDGTPTDPAIQTGDVLNGEALVNEMKLWRIPIDGLNVGTPEKLFTVKKDFNQLAPEVEKLKSNTMTNLLNPTLETTTSHGITCTANNDGTYTIEGTATAKVILQFREIGTFEHVKAGTYKGVGCPSGGSTSTFILRFEAENGTSYVKGYGDDKGNGVTFTIPQSDEDSDYGLRVCLTIFSGAAFPSGGLTFKPMITTNLDATYDDFVAYSGDGELNENVAAIRKMIFPIGFIYASTDPTSPAQLFGGTWERIKDCMIYAAGDSDTVGRVVGSNTHTLTVAELPSHNHGMQNHTHTMSNHTHSIPALSGVTTINGDHRHWVFKNSSSGNAPTFNFAYLQGTRGGDNNYIIAGGSQEPDIASTNASGNHQHTVTTNASTTGANNNNTSGPSNNTTTSTGSGTAIDMRSARYNTYAWRKIA